MLTWQVIEKISIFCLKSWYGKIAFCFSMKELSWFDFICWGYFCFVFLFSLVIASPFGCLCYRTEPLGTKFKKQSLMMDTFVFLILETYRC